MSQKKMIRKHHKKNTQNNIGFQLNLFNLAKLIELELQVNQPLKSFISCIVNFFLVYSINLIHTRHIRTIDLNGEKYIYVYDPQVHFITYLNAISNENRQIQGIRKIVFIFSELNAFFHVCVFHLYLDIILLWLLFEMLTKIYIIALYLLRWK